MQSTNKIRLCGCHDGIVEDDCVDENGVCAMCREKVRTYVNVDDAERRDRERIVAILDDLAELYTPEGVGVWLMNRNRLLGGESALDKLRAGRIGEVEIVVEQLTTGAFE